MTFLDALVADWTNEFRTGRIPESGEVLFGTAPDPGSPSCSRFACLSFAEAGERRFVLCPEELRESLTAFFRKNLGDLFSADALGELMCLTAPFLSRNSLTPDRFPLRHIVCCLPDGISFPACTESREGIRRLSGEDFLLLENRTTLRELDPERQAAYGMIIGERICSIATVHPSSGRICRELLVECEPSERGKGYGSGCVRMLSEFLVRSGEIPLYEYYSDNESSERAARRAGFVPAGRRYTLYANRR